MCIFRQFVVPRSGVFILCLLTLPLSACSSGSDELNFSGTKNVHEVIDAATGPLEDLNIKQRDIPPLLEKIAEDPYAPPTPLKCAKIRTELGELEALLGPDIKPAAEGVEMAHNERVFSDIQNLQMPDAETVADTGGDFLHDKIIGLVRDQTNILPFRSVLRSITGANRYQRKVENAYLAGKLRRAYLKGLAQSKFGKSCLKTPLIPVVPSSPAAGDMTPGWGLKTPDLPIKL